MGQRSDPQMRALGVLQDERDLLRATNMQLQVGRTILSCMQALANKNVTLQEQVASLRVKAAMADQAQRTQAELEQRQQAAEREVRACMLACLNGPFLCTCTWSVACPMGLIHSLLVCCSWR